MNHTSMRKITRVLSVLVMVTFICNLVALPLVPKLVLRMQHVGRSYHIVLSVFLVFCGCCTAVVLWQGRRVLKTILRGEPFAVENAVSLQRAAVGFFLIAVAALTRVVWSVIEYRSLAPVASYNALFVPVFAMAGLLSLILSALFRQATELKAENDLTI